MAARKVIKNGQYFKSLFQRYKHYEVYIPNEFTILTPWGEDPRCLSPGYYAVKDGVPRRPTDITIHGVSHITHNKEAGIICSTSDCITFTANPKLGKTHLSDSRRGEPYSYVKRDQDIFKVISGQMEVLPGYLSWWGINCEGFYSTPEGELVSKYLKQQKDYIPEYLKQPVESRYGNHSFSTSLKDFFEGYQRSRADKTGCKVQLKTAGTLRYKRKASYVVMACMEGELGDMPPVGDHDYSRPFIPNGLVDDNGAVVNTSAVPTFRAAFITKSQAYGYNWDDLAFALYYPSERGHLTLPSDSVKHSVIKHQVQFCLSKRPDVTGRWKCPNEVLNYHFCACR